MAAEQIEQATWGTFLAALTRTLVGKQAEIEVAALDLGDQVEAEWTPLIGITYDEKDDLIEIAVDALVLHCRSGATCAPAAGTRRSREAEREGG